MKNRNPSHSLFYLLDFFFSPVFLKQTKAIMDELLKFKSDIVEDAIWRWKNLCESLWIL